MRVLKKRRSTEFLLLCGVIGPLLFILVFLIEGATRPGYSAWRTDVSYLALSNQGWEQIANFIVCGSLCIAFAVGLWQIWRTGRASVWGPLLIGLFGLGLLIAGVFVTDPGGGIRLVLPSMGPRKPGTAGFTGSTGRCSFSWCSPPRASCWPGVLLLTRNIVVGLLTPGLLERSSF